MKGLIKTNAGEFKLLLNPHAIARARCDPDLKYRGINGGVFVGMMTGEEWHLDCTYADFELAWTNALNFADEVGGPIAGVVST